MTALSGKKLTFAFWIGFGFVVILNFLVWIYLEQTGNRFQQELETRLRNSGQLLSRLMSEYSNDFNLNLLIPGEQKSSEYFFYQLTLENIRQKNNLQSIIITSPQGEILVSSPAVLGSAQYTSLVQRPEFSEAVRGHIAISGIETYDKERFLSGFIPITDIDGFLMGILILEVRADYFTTLTKLRDQLLLFSLLNMALILIIAFYLFRNIKRAMNYEREIQNQEHLVQLGTMAASVAHELRNPLGIIDATNDLIKKKYGDKKDEVFNYIPDEIKRLSGLIDEFLAFSRTPALHIETFKIRDILDWLTLNLSDAERKKFTIINPDTEAQFCSDRNLVQQILLNLVKNSMQATADDGRVTLDIRPGVNKMEWLISDNGNGISPENLEKIFKPFFTTKEKGTGLGLAICGRLVRHLQGDINVSSREGAGTTFTLLLPALKPA